MEDIGNGSGIRMRLLFVVLVVDMAISSPRIQIIFAYEASRVLGSPLYSGPRLQYRQKQGLVPNSSQLLLECTPTVPLSTSDAVLIR
jgi:hypothetical protein